MLRSFVVLVSLMSMFVPALSFARNAGPSADATSEVMLTSRPERDGREQSRYDTLWIFDADFEDLTGDNAGWLTYSLNGTLPSSNYWHKDSLFTDAFPSLGESAWWCGTYDDCFVQGQGYGNSWTCVLVRDVALWTPEHDVIQAKLEFDQRFAMEHDYDCGYVDVSNDDGDTWTTLASYSNTGFLGQPGTPQDWDSSFGHQNIDLSSYSEDDIKLRFRFVSDSVVSSEDTPDNGSHSLLNGAWQIDNIEVEVYRTLLGDWEQVFWDDCESPGDNGWDTPSFEGAEQFPVFNRFRYGIDIVSHRDPYCGEPPVGTWMMAAVDPATSRTVPGMDSWLLSPPIDISGLTSMVGQWDMWIDLPSSTGDRFDLLVGYDDGDECVADRLRATIGEDEGVWYGGPYYGRYTDTWDDYTGHDWFKVAWRYFDSQGYTTERFGGIYLDRQRVGTVIGGPEGRIDPTYCTFRDWFSHESVSASIDTMWVETTGFTCVDMRVVVWDSAVGPGSATSVQMYQDPYSARVWYCPMPMELWSPGTEFHYYVEGFDPEMSSVLYPKDAPDEVLEFSILPRGGSVLLVDKHRGYAPGYDGAYEFRTSYYYESTLDILGYTWDRFDSPLWSQMMSSIGPDATALGNYETVIWFSGDNSFECVTYLDAEALTTWLDEAAGGATRNLVFTGNDLVYEVYQSGDPFNLMSDYMALIYAEDDVGSDVIDVCDVEGGSDFLTSPGGCTALAAWCPQLAEFDTILPDYMKSEIALSYETGTNSYIAACAHDAAEGYSVVTYGFGIEYMEAAAIESGEGNGLPFMVNLLGNTLDYVETPPDTTPTGVGGTPPVNSLSAAHPNPLNPVTTIAYSVKESGPVAIRVYNAAGRLVRTLLDAEVEAGVSGEVVWDGRDESGGACGSGVYFYRIDARGFESTQKMVLLK